MLWSKKYLVIVFTAALAGCGFQPIYGTANQQNIKSELAAVQISPIKDRIGQQLRNHLLNQINPKGRSVAPRYVLSVTLTESKQELAVQKLELATRANLNFIANFSLSPVEGVRSSLLTGQVRITTSYNILSSDFGTLMAERDARRRAVREMSLDITNRIAAHVQNTGAG
jgi:LPS-assembly lipoprotein